MDITDFLAGGIAACAATIFTNPLEVVKTRLQLQGELAKRGTYVKAYKGVVHAFVTIAKHDGILALQKGLPAALYFQFILSSFRLGIYQSAFNKGWMHDTSGRIEFTRGLFWGAVGGVVGSLMSSPFLMIKTQLQAQSVESIAVGYQHKHAGMIDAIRDIHSKYGFRGLWRGAQIAIPRGICGSGAQLAAFGSCKEYFMKKSLFSHPLANSFAAGVVAGSVTALAINPPDVLSTRVYNQGFDDCGKGLTYRSPFDCLMKVLRTEGIFGLYKGFWPNYIRLAPHSTLILFFFDIILKIKS